MVHGQQIQTNGAFIKDMFKKEWISKIENNKVLSNFDYTQGDYYRMS